VFVSLTFPLVASRRATYLETSLLGTSRLILVDATCTFSLSSFTTFASLVDYSKKGEIISEVM